MRDNLEGGLYWRVALVHQGICPSGFNSGDGEKCKRVNLRCGEKVFRTEKSGDRQIRK